jgi:hypothetical protein
VGWPAAVGNGHVALEAVLSSGRRTPWPGVHRRSPLGLASQNSILALGIGLHSSVVSTVPESTYPRPTLVRTGVSGS